MVDFPDYTEQAPLINWGGKPSLILHQGQVVAEVHHTLGFFRLKARLLRRFYRAWRLAPPFIRDDEDKRSRIFLKFSEDFQSEVMELCPFAILKRLELMRQSILG